MANNYFYDDTYNFVGVVGKALLQYRSGINNHCASYDPFGLDNIMQCLYCDNCYYKITMENGEFITNTNVDLNGFPTDSRGFEEDDHIILFYDYVPKTEDLFNYLFSDSSEFKVVRTCDTHVMYNRAKTKELVPKVVNKNKNKKHKKGRK